VCTLHPMDHKRRMREADDMPTEKPAVRPSRGSASARSAVTAQHNEHAGPERTDKIDAMSQCSFPASDPPAVWTWEVRPARRASPAQLANQTRYALTRPTLSNSGPAHNYPPCRSEWAPRLVPFGH
jgi:hypothetical protein